MPDTTYESEQLRATRNLIANAPTTLTLMRAARSQTAAGGVAAAGEPDPVGQPITVFLGAKVQDDLPMQTNEGNRVVSYYTIVALPGTDIREGDIFTLRGDNYRVTRVSNHLTYECKADVQTYYGGYR